MKLNFKCQFVKVWVEHRKVVNFKDHLHSILTEKIKDKMLDVRSQSVGEEKKRRAAEEGKKAVEEERRRNEEERRRVEEGERRRAEEARVSKRWL